MALVVAAEAEEEIDFTAEGNVCGQTLLALVARGSANIAELLRLSNHVPDVFRDKPEDPAEAAKYEAIVHDFAYLKNAEAYDERVDADIDLADLDESFRESHYELLERFYKLFESVYKFVSDLNQFIEEVSDGTFVAHTVENILLDVEGKQLMCEALYLYGVMLLLLDLRMPGAMRERLVVSYYRYKGAGSIPNIEAVLKLTRNTGYTGTDAPRPSRYPEDYFARFSISSDIIRMMVVRLRSDDVYRHTSAFPAPEHRSTALADQAAMLFVILFFAPDLLHKNEGVMREIVDKNFADNWVVPFYMGYTVDLGDAWKGYAAAGRALKNVLNKEGVTRVTSTHVQTLGRLLKQLAEYLVEGVLTDDYVLDHVRPLMHCARECNVVLRWLLLQRTTTNAACREYILNAVPVAAVMQLMTSAAQFEWLLKSSLRRLMDVKLERWEHAKREAHERMSELSHYFSGTAALTRVKKNDNLVAWFAKLSSEIQALDFYSSHVISGRKIAHLIHSLKEVCEFEDIYASLQVKSFIGDTQEHLTTMVRVINVRQKTLNDLDIVTDYSYAWQLINAYTEEMHVRLKKAPAICLLLRATFIKLSSILSLPLVRITQAASKDDVSVAQYFSGELVAYVRTVLHIIPRSVFEVLGDIVELLTHQLAPLPIKLERKALGDCAQLDARHKLAKLTHQVSVYTEGILSMETTLMGIIRLDPREVLETGVRRELVQRIAHALNGILVFRSGTVRDFEQRAQALGRKLDGFRLSFEYIQDYLNVYGLKVWQEEVYRIVNYYVEQECNSFLKRKIYDWQSTFQSDDIPIPRSFPDRDPRSVSINFMGRLARELLRQTDPRATAYVELRQGWFDNAQALGDPTDKKRRKQGGGGGGDLSVDVVGIRTFSLLHKGVDIFGLAGLDKLLSFMIVQALTDFVRLYRRHMIGDVRNTLVAAAQQLSPMSQFPPNARALYRAAAKATAKLWSLFHMFVVRVGQCQLLRRQIGNELNFACRMDSKLLVNTLQVANQALISDLRAHYMKPDEKEHPDNALLSELASYLETAGISSPATRIYVTPKPVEQLPMFLFLYTLEMVGEQAVRWSEKLASLVSVVPSNNLDGPPLVMGIITILKQFHASHTHTYLSLLGQFVRVSIGGNDPVAGGADAAKEAEKHASAAASGAPAALPALVRNVLLFLDEYCKFSHTPRDVIAAVVPSYIFDRFAHN